MMHLKPKYTYFHHDSTPWATFSVECSSSHSRHFIRQRFTTLCFNSCDLIWGCNMFAHCIVHCSVWGISLSFLEKMAGGLFRQRFIAWFYSIPFYCCCTLHTAAYRAHFRLSRRLASSVLVFISAKILQSLWSVSPSGHEWVWQRKAFQYAARSLLIKGF